MFAKKLLMGFMAIVLAASGIGVPRVQAYAVSADANNPDSIVLGSSDAFGAWGDNLTWAYDSQTKTVTISGEGEMQSFWQRASWEAVGLSEFDFDTVVIEEGVTNVGANAFHSCANLTSITIPESVNSIDGYAFYGCESLSSIELPGGVVSVGGMAFIHCVSLSSISIPVSVIQVGSNAFLECASLSDVYYGGDESQRFAITVSEGNELFEQASWHCESSNAPITGSWGSNLSWSYDESSRTAVISGAGPMVNYANSSEPAGYKATGLGQYPFETLIISEGVTTIGEAAFYGCTSLGYVSIPDTVTSIGPSAFWRCTSLSSVAIPEGVTSIEDGAFRDCTSLHWVSIPDTVTSIGPSAFWRCTSLSSVAIPEGVTSIGFSAFDLCSSLASVSIPASVVSIGGQSFSNCTSLRSVSISEGVAAIEESAFRGCVSLSVVSIPETVASVGDSAFRDCTSLQDVHYAGLAAGKDSISFGAYNEPLLNAFWQYEWGLASASGAWGDNLTWAYDSETKAVTISGEGEMANSDLPGYDAMGLSGLPVLSVVVSEGVTSISDYAFFGWASLENATVSSSVSRIGDSSFRRCASLRHVDLPQSMDSIGWYAFEGCASLGDFSIPQGVAAIEHSTFMGCASLSSIAIPSSVTVISISAFRGCSALSSIEIPSSVANVYTGAFADCSSLASVSLSRGMSTIGELCFENCSSLSCVYVPETLTAVSFGAFSGCSSLSDVFYGGSESQRLNIAVYEGNELFEQASWHYSEDSEEGSSDASGAWGDNLTWCYDVSTKTLSISGVGEMLDCSPSAQGAYVTAAPWSSYLSDIERIEVSEGVTSIGAYAFMGCDQISSIDISSTVTTIGHDAFGYCSSLESVLVPEGVESIQYQTFLGCSSLESVVLPMSLSAIDENAFNGCSSLSSIELPEQIDMVSYGSFAFCSSLKGIDIPEGVISVSADAFRGCASLESVRIPSSLQSIGMQAFYECSSLKSILLPAGINSVGRMAFQGLASGSVIYVESEDLLQQLSGNSYYLSADRTTVKLATFDVVGGPDDADFVWTIDDEDQYLSLSFSRTFYVESSFSPSCMWTSSNEAVGRCYSQSTTVNSMNVSSPGWSSMSGSTSTYFEIAGCGATTINCYLAGTVIASAKVYVDKGVVSFDLAQGFLYSGDGIWHPGKRGIILSGQTVATNVGVYRAVATLDDCHIWEDGSSDPKSFEWEILARRMRGDVNGNRTVNIVDAQLAYDLAKGLYWDRIDLAAMNDAADVTGMDGYADGFVDSQDAFRIQYAVLHGCDV